MCENERTIALIPVGDVGILELKSSVKDVVDQYLPPMQEFTHKTSCTSIDPEIQRRYLERVKKSWVSMTPGRFVMAPQEHEEQIRSGGSTVVGYKLSLEAKPSSKRPLSPEESQRVKKARGEGIGRRALAKIIRGKEDKRRRYAPENSKIIQAQGFKIEHTRITSSGWKGVHPAKLDRERLTDMLLASAPQLMEVLRAFARLHYDRQQKGGTRVVDCDGRLLIYRAKIPTWIIGLLPTLAVEVENFTNAAHYEPDSRKGNLRGNHKFCIVGYDRQNKSEIRQSGWERKGQNSAAMAVLMATVAMTRLNNWVNSVLEEHFPELTKRMHEDMETLCNKYGLPKSPYGYFWNFCINSLVSEEGILDVFCLPHADAHNGAILVCAVFVYYYGQCDTNSDEKIWLVFWEAGIIMEIPAGTLVFYPSALLLHFNVDINEVLKVTEDGSHPTPESARPFKENNSSRGGRGSMVWFTQASMLMSARLPTATKREAEELEKELQKQYPSKVPHFSTTFDVAQALADDLFPSRIEKQYGNGGGWAEEGWIEGECEGDVDTAGRTIRDDASVRGKRAEAEDPLK
ncbi:hypothetical protein BDY19DRAFT_998859 [Irpex rosettiformis]|uniref:Uncharacterized protein n=1 Tax=Irpex rosettiformis TaxID=378272 RepID=A0ACB8TMA3_9APHY|nr:hypothetical protein BDY19DRAFT_998859 [Irpex rosettiformis]